MTRRPSPPCTSLRRSGSSPLGRSARCSIPLRLGYLAAPPELTAPLCERKRLSDHHTNPVYQLALASFLSDGTLEKHIRRMKREYRARRDHLTDCLRRQFGGGVRVSGGASGMNLVADFDGVRFTDERVRELLRCGAERLKAAMDRF